MSENFPFLGGGGGSFYSSGRSATNFNGTIGTGGEGGKGFLQGGLGGRSERNNVDGGFGGGGGAEGWGDGEMAAEEEEDTLEEAVEVMILTPVAEGEDLSVQEQINKTSVSTTQLVMVR